MSTADGHAAHVLVGADDSAETTGVDNIGLIQVESKNSFTTVGSDRTAGFIFIYQYSRTGQGEIFLIKVQETRCKNKLVINIGISNKDQLIVYSFSQHQVIKSSG